MFENVTPQALSRVLQVQLKDSGIILPRVTRNFQSDLSMGKEVVLGGVGEITVGTGTTSINYQDAPTFSQLIKIDSDPYFAINLPDKSIKQSMVKMLPFVQKGANALAAEMDQKIAYLAYSAQKSIGASAEVGATEITPLISEARAFIRSNSEDAEMAFLDLYVGPYTAEVIRQVMVNKATDNQKALMNGYIGSINGFNVFETSNIHTTGTFGTDLVEYNFAMISPAAVGAVIQADPTSEVVRRDAAFADGLRGMALWGKKLIGEKKFVAVVIKPDLSD
ncbi:MAG TPA: hypothetical protein PLD55_04290 [bacterium]|nr:hypothetical protein [bacterium]